MTLQQDLIRSLAEEGMTPRLVKYSETTFAAFQIAPDVGKTYAHGELEATGLNDAVNEALTRNLFDHKDHLLIREVGPKGVKLHLYAIKRKSAPRYVHRDHVTRRVNDLYAALVCSIDGGVLRAAL